MYTLIIIPCRTPQPLQYPVVLTFLSQMRMYILPKWTEIPPMITAVQNIQPGNFQGLSVGHPQRSLLQVRVSVTMLSPVYMTLKTYCLMTALFLTLVWYTMCVDTWISKLTLPGDKRGARHFVYDLCHPGSPQDSTPCIVQREPNVSWKPHELEYLRYEGAFNTLPSDVCDDLIRCYFHHVHFFLPVIDAAPFLDEYTKNGRQNISLVLFWSMLLAAANVSNMPIHPKETD
jgi:hypothetical protein